MINWRFFNKKVLIGSFLLVLTLAGLFIATQITSNRQASLDIRSRADNEGDQPAGTPPDPSGSSPIVSADGFNSAVALTFDNKYPTDKDWIALAKPGSRVNSYVDWRSLADNNTLTKIGSGTVTFTNVASGDYEVRYSPSAGNEECSVKGQMISVSPSSPKLLHQWSFNNASEMDGVGTGNDPHVWNQWKLFNYSSQLPPPSVSLGSLFIKGSISSNGVYLGYKDSQDVPGFLKLSSSRSTVVEIIMKSSTVPAGRESNYKMRVQLFSNVFGEGTPQIIGSVDTDAVANAGRLRKFFAVFPSNQAGGKKLKSVKIYLTSSSTAIQNLQIDTIRVFSK